MAYRSDRREFVRSAAGSLATATALAAAPGQVDGRARLGFIGVGGHGIALVRQSLRLDYVTVPAICDITERNLDPALDEVERSGRKRPKGTPPTRSPTSTWSRATISTGF